MTADHERWYAAGATVVELSYLGRGQYAAEATTVVRLTPRQIVTATGRRFWRYGAANPLALVGQRSNQIAGIRVNIVRLVSPDNRHAAATLAPQSDADMANARRVAEGA